MRTRIILWEETKRESVWDQKQIKEEREGSDKILSARIF